MPGTVAPVTDTEPVPRRGPSPARPRQQEAPVRPFHAHVGASGRTGCNWLHSPGYHPFRREFGDPRCDQPCLVDPLLGRLGLGFLVLVLAEHFQAGAFVALDGMEVRAGASPHVNVGCRAGVGPGR